MIDEAHKILRCFPPEIAHNLAITGLKISGDRLPPRGPLLGLQQDLVGLKFLNPIGLAAGLDKDAKALLGLARLGFGHIEVGTVTPKPQFGNPKPRLFRIRKSEALINRMGFNNEGVESMVGRLEKIRRENLLGSTLVGVNLGKNKTTPNEKAVEDYLACMRAVGSLSDYFTLNLSSPNTPGLRELQYGETLRKLLTEFKEGQLALGQDVAAKPVFLKIAPDLSEKELDQIAAVFLETKIDGLIATNTTLSRIPELDHRHLSETGGMSGRPLFDLSRWVVKNMRARLGQDHLIIAVGGIDSEERAQKMMDSGANLLQIYTSFIYKGTKLVHKLIKASSKTSE